MTRAKIIHLFGTVTSLCFLLVIVAPLMIMKFSAHKDVSIVEKRRLKEKPELSFHLEQLEQYPEEYERFFNDHFGLRSKFVSLYNILFVSLLGTSPSFDVIVGKERWLFYATGFAYQDYTGNKLYPEWKLPLYKQIVKERVMWLEKNNIEYVLLPVPYKIAIYSEFLPDRIQRIEGQTYLDQLIDYLHESPAIEQVIDIKKKFIAQKNAALLYYKTDTHWNYLGAYSAYEEIMSRLQPTLPGLKQISFGQLEKKKNRFNGNLTNFINIGSLYEEDEVVLELAEHKDEIQFSKYDLPPKPDETYQAFRRGRAKISKNETGTYKAIVITDSFGTALERFLSASFAEVIFVRDARFEDMMHLIEAVEPDAVIDLNGSVRFDLALGESVRLRNMSVKKVFGKAKPFFTLENNELGKVTKQIVGAEIGKSKQNLLVSKSEDPQLYFDLPEIETNSPLYVHCKITAPADSTVQLFYQTREQQSYTPRNMVEAKVKKGRNDIYLRIYDRILLDTLRVDFGATPGQYQLNEFELIL